ncbi:MAG: leucyl aminopeptidase, partial [Chloroflexota bacterium]|nr:leucyl aminopeptidase [Chloroflexota bacterium]
LPVFEDGWQDDAVLERLDGQLSAMLQEHGQAGRIASKPNRVTTVLAPGNGPVRRVLAIGSGSRESWDATRARQYAGTAVRELRTTRVAEAAVVLPRAGELQANVAAAVHGAYIGNFSTGSYKTKDQQEQDVESLTLVVPDGDQEQLSGTVERASAIGEGINLARHLANEPGNRLPPEVLAERALEVASESGLEAEVLDEQGLQERAYGAILGVAQGSEHPPRMVTLRYQAGADLPTIGYVGKGITFDTGGISIKPADRMHLMKTDMSGAAAVLGAMQAIARIKPRANVVAVLCLAENMPSGSAIKPGDILVAGNGMTIEVINTDAEGRLVLADGLVHARAQGATHLVDVATLTGACVVALGTITTGVFGSSQPWTDLLLRAAEHTGERMWQLPMAPEYREQMNSDIADIANAGGREGGAITAAAFIQDFTDGAPWVHLDIAGTSRHSKKLPYADQGPTGVAVATLTRLAELAGSEGLPEK